MFATFRDNNVFSKYVAIFKQSPGQVFLLLMCLVALVYCMILNFSAIGYMIHHGTGVHPFTAIVTFFIFTQLLKYADLEGDAIGKYVGQALWLTMGAIGFYWVCVYSNWETFNKVILAIFQLTSYVTIITIIMNVFNNKKS